MAVSEAEQSTPAERLHRLGGVATRRALVDAIGRQSLEVAVRRGDIVLVGRGRYALPSVEQARRVAHGLSGVLCQSSAALAWGWAVKSPPLLPRIVVPKHRRISAERGRGAEVHYADLGADDVAGDRTSRDRTLVDCLRLLPFDEALAVADSALRDGLSWARLSSLARDLRGPGSRRARHVADVADGRAANPFESVLRAIALDVPGLSVTPQVSVRQSLPRGESVFLGRPDLVDERLRIAIEADSFTWHGDRAALVRDARRYNALAAGGWLVLRFCWEDVMSRQDSVAAVLRRAAGERTDQRCPACRQAWLVA